ncbi:MAG: hypothetical protein LBK99_19745 [Opitutaceae bacterium]|nr:hypothetical protein [Opitutaceae bacterium]
MATLPFVCGGSQDQRFYYQNEWGTDRLRLQRIGENGLRITANQPGTYAIWDDGAGIGGVLSIHARFEDVGDVEITPVLLDHAGFCWVGKKPAREGDNRWLPDDFTPTDGGAGIPVNITDIRWRLRTKAPASVVLKKCFVEIANGETRVFFADTKALPRWVTPKPEPDAGHIPADYKSPRVIVAENAIAVTPPARVKIWKAWAEKNFPGRFGIDSGAITPYAGLAEGMRDYNRAGFFNMFEAHFVSSASLKAWARNNHLYATRWDGFTPDQALWPSSRELGRRGFLDFHAIDTTQEPVFEMMRERLNTVFDLGYDSFLLIDYIWPYAGGRWGYGESAVAQWIRYLKGTGLELSLKSPEETWGFADYWSRFSSIPLTPESFGWPSWDAFVCATEKQAKDDPMEAKRLLLFNALWHFHHLAFIDRLGRVAVARGRELSIGVNPEDVSNGSDFTLFGRLANLGSVGIEFFGTPSQLATWRHTLAPLRHRDGGPEMDLVGEINAGGHGPSRYDRETAFAFYYDATGSCKLRFYNTQYVEGPWPERALLGAAQQERFDHWMAGANAFLLRRQEEDNIVRKRADVTVVASRSVLEYQAGSSHSLEQEGNLAAYLNVLNVDFEQVGRDAWNGILDTNTRVLFFCPALATTAQLGSVRTWIEGAGGEERILVLHGGAAWRSDRNIERPATDAVVWKPDASYRDSVLMDSGVKEVIDISLLPKPVCLSKTLRRGDRELQARWWDAPREAQGIASGGRGREVLFASEEGTPLLTAWRVGENRVFHINPDLPVRGGINRLGVDIVAAVLDKTGIRPFAPFQPEWAINRHPAPGGAVVVAWNKALLREQEKAKRFDRVALKIPGVVKVSVEPGKAFRVYSVFDGATWLLKSDASGILSLPAKDSPDIFYYGPESETLMATFAEARRAVARAFGTELGDAAR